MKKLTVITFAALALLANIAKSQNFKWVTGGGAPDPTAYQNVAFMCTDPSGNVYALSIVSGSDPITADTFHSSFYYGVNKIILITSYNCSGQLRWAKPIGSANTIVPRGIAADSLGNVYVAALFQHESSPLYIGSDTTIPGGTYYSNGIAQFDTSGSFHWIRFLGVNTYASALAVSAGLGDPLITDAANYPHYFCYVQTGVPLLAGDTSVFGVYDIKYNTSGTMLSAVRLDLDSEWYLMSAVIDPATNKLYVCGQVNMSMGLGVDTFFAAAFDASRNNLWQYPGLDASAIAGVTLDKSKNLYFSGNASPFVGETTFSFNGDSVSAPFNNLAIIMKTDTTGKVKWLRHFDSHAATNYFGSITELPNNLIAVTGTYGGNVVYGTTDSLVVLAGEYLNPFIVIVDSAGDLETMQQMYEDGPTAGYNGANIIVSDRVGNMYIGGAVQDSVWGGTLPAFHTVGGESNFFVAKFGLDCSCTTMPIAAYTDTGTHTIGFTYTGTTAGIDSVVWNFDDGHTGTGTTALHTYSVSGTYRTCVTVYTDCGEDLYCSNVTVHIPSEIEPVVSVNGLSIYPNPVGDMLNVTGVVGNTSYRLVSVTGVCMQAGILGFGNNIISIKDFAAGVYILEMTGENGVRNMVRVVKE